MAIKVFWTEFAKLELKGIFEYFHKNVNSSVAQTLVEEIVIQTLKLAQNPEMGFKEPLLENRKENFRSLVFKNYKIIYWVNHDENRIEINDVFDTRQNPIKIKRN